MLKSLNIWAVAALLGLVGGVLTAWFQLMGLQLVLSLTTASVVVGLGMLAAMHARAGIKLWQLKVKRRRVTMSDLEEGPRPPQNVRVQWSTGEVVPIELMHMGVVMGLTCWVPTAPLICPPGANQVPELLYDGEMPTGIMINLAVAQKMER